MISVIWAVWLFLLIYFMFMKQMCKDHVLCTSKLPHMSVLFEREITLVLAFHNAGGRAVRNICCRQIWWGMKLHKAPSIWQVVFSVARNFGLVSYLPHTLWDVFSQMFSRMRFRCILLFLKTTLETKVGTWWIFGRPKFWGMVLKWLPCAVVSVWCCFDYSLKIFPSFSLNWGLCELYCFQVACLKAIIHTEMMLKN